MLSERESASGATSVVPSRWARGGLLVARWAAQRLLLAAHSPALRGGALVAVVAALLTVAFHINRPQPFIPFHDTYEYVRRADIILAGGPFADPIRLPGYPLLLALLFAFTGKGNYAAAEALQNAMFIVTAVVVYALAWRIWRDARLAALVGTLFGANLFLYSYFRAILSDGLGALLVVGLALAVVAFLEHPCVARIWPVAALCLAALITRGEWIAAPVVLFPYLLLVAHRREVARRLLAPMGAALALIYGAVAGYMALNWRINGYFGMTDATNINLYGKITQYRMQGQAPPRFSSIAAVTERFTRRGLIDPWSIYWRDQAIAGRHFAHMGAYAQAIILHHPIEYLAHSAPIAYISLYDAYVFGGFSHTGPLGGFTGAIQSFSYVIYPLFMLFPLCAAFWLVVALRRRPHAPGAGAALRVRFRAEALGALSLLALYALAITTLTSYSEYGRLHLAFDPFMLVVVIGSLAAIFAARKRSARLVAPLPTSVR